MQTIKEESEANKSTANTVAFMMGAFAFIISFLRSVLNDEEEINIEEETQEINNTIYTDEKRHYIFEAMKIRAKDLQYKLDNSPGGVESMTFPINKTRDKAIYLARKDKKMLSISKDNATNLIIDLKKREGELEQWLATQSWNMFTPRDSNYHDDLEVS